MLGGYVPDTGPSPTPNAINQGPCPNHTYDLTNATDIHSVDRNCGSAFFPAGYEGGAFAFHGQREIPAGLTQAWNQVPPCSGRLSTWRYPALALVFAGVVVALAGCLIFRTRKRQSPTAAIPQ